MANPVEPAIELMTAALSMLDEGGMSLAAIYLQHSIDLAIGAPTLPVGGGLAPEAEAFPDE